jgi:hypothetical protein
MIAVYAGRQRSIHVTCALVCAAMWVATPSLAQSVRRDPAVVQASVLAGSVEAATPVLSQRTQVYSRSEQDLVANAVVDIAIAAGRRQLDPNAPKPGGVGNASSDAVLVLTEAGMGEGTLAYPGAADALRRIALAGILASHVAASNLRYMKDQDAALRYLQEIAGTNVRFGSDAAILALDLRGERGEQQALAFLKGLYTSQAVTEPIAKTHLEMIAARRGWKVP